MRATPLQDPENLKKLVEVLKRQLEKHRSSQDRSLAWVLEEAKILDNLIMVQMQLEKILKERPST
ncbi:hypothetical protein DES53_104484 [Roseimicrobium gellanilyticum]|uniref:Uncharacterized protein n=1 Tax=Roseimicrobium gellanilyticum TaxID=748857 RepID=A0A366HNA3_9BACT|nr:hypothetical protein [Roseimicrobium gellanilyticum]RBP44662.1 hypothetical protein DES53_104484 [Roseimicrobium gellanilyticum]